jgi:hypothetical protein
MPSYTLALPFRVGDVNNYPFEGFRTNVFQVRAMRYSNGSSIPAPVEARLNLEDETFTSSVQELIDLVGLFRI